MKNQYRFVSSLSLVAILTSAVALAGGPPPVVGAAAGNLGVGVGIGGPGPNVGAGIGAAGGGAFQGGPVGGAFSGGAATTGVFNSTESIGMRQERFAAKQDADVNASVMGEARGRTVARLAARGPSGSLETKETVHAIQARAMDSREELLAELHLRMDASSKAMADLRKSNAKLEGSAKADFAKANADVKAQEKALNKSMKACEKASAETWTESRAKLATDFDAYASAVARAEAAGRVDMKAASKPADKSTDKPASKPADKPTG